jgi:glutamine amidotransferase
MCRDTEEGAAEGLRIFDAHVKRFKEAQVGKVPHIGWNDISNLESKLFKGLSGKDYVYFVHSYRAGLCNDTIATCRYGEMFSAALKYENFYGTQFHPEKSGDVGERIIKNFLEL